MGGQVERGETGGQWPVAKKKGKCSRTRRRGYEHLRPAKMTCTMHGSCRGSRIENPEDTTAFTAFRPRQGLARRFSDPDVVLHIHIHVMKCH